MIVINSARSMHERGYTLAAYCATCERWAVIDLERMIADGRGDERLVGRGARCKYCGGPGTFQLRSPCHHRAPAALIYAGYTSAVAPS